MTYSHRTTSKQSALVAQSIGVLALISAAGCAGEVSFGTPPKEPTPPPVQVAPAPPPPPAPPVAVPVLAPLPRRASVEGDRVKIPGELEFDTDSSKISDTQQSREILNSLAQYLKENPNVTKMRIEGHTDNTGTTERNMKLSQERADAVVQWLGTHGIDSKRLVTVGHGSSKPLAPNDSAEHKQMNRRTEFHIHEIDGKLHSKPTAGH